MFGFSKKTTRKAKKVGKAAKKVGNAFLEVSREVGSVQKKRAKKVTGGVKRVANHVNKKMWGEI